MFAVTIEVTWPGVVAGLTALTLLTALLSKAFRSNVGHRIAEAVFAPVLYELRTNDGGSLKDHIMRRFDSIEDEMSVGRIDRSDLHHQLDTLESKFDAEIARTRHAVNGEIDDREDAV